MPYLTSLLQSKNVPFKRHGEHHHATKDRIQIDCPNCTPNTQRYRLGFKLTTGQADCWQCGRLDSAKIISEICHISLSDAITFLKQLPKAYETPIPERTGSLVLPKGIGELQTPHKRYLKQRGFNPDYVANTWGVQGIGVAAKLAWRLFIPIHDSQGVVVSWTTRSIARNPKRRYISAPEDQEAVSHKTILYGEHLAGNSIVVVEGPIDAWAIGPGAVATCGTGFSGPQTARIARYACRTVCLDREAQERAQRLCDDLSAFPGRTEIVELETGDDPAEADRTEIRELRERFL